MSDYMEEMAELQEKAEAKMIDDAIEGATKKLRARIAELEAERDSIRDEALEEAAKACERQQVVFASDDYAIGQPWSSHAERFACSRCFDAIRALKGGKP